MSSVFKPPKIFGVIDRRRLFNLLDTVGRKRHVLILGQAAQGKSTLAASYLNQSNEKVLWISLTESDNDPSRFYEKITSGLMQINATGQAAEALQIPRSTLGPQEKGLRYLDALTSLSGELSGQVTLVLDDLQHLDEQSGSYKMVRHLLKVPPEILRLILLSRKMPKIDVAQMKMKQQLVVIENDQLAFTLEETGLFFEKMESSADLDIKRIQNITQGWVGGLVLLGESIRQIRDVPELPAKLNSDLFDFFSQEIYSRLNDTIKLFLTGISILDTIEVGPARHITGEERAQSILTELEKRNLFIQRIETRSGDTAFKCHDLFRQFLMKKREAAYGLDNVCDLNCRAGQYFWDNNAHEKAMMYFIKSRSFDDMVRIIRIKAKDYVIRGKMEIIEKWLGYLPEKRIETDSWLLFFSAMARRIKGGRKNMGRLKDAFGMFQQEKDIRGMLLSTGFLIEAAVFLRQPAGMIAGWISKGEALLKEAGDSERFPWARTLLWQQIGLGYIAGNGDIPKGISACRNAILLGRQIKSSELVINASITMTFGHVQAGDFARAKTLLEQIGQMVQTNQMPEYRALKTIVDIELATKNADFKKAGELIDQTENDIEKFGLIFLYPGFVEGKAVFFLHTGQYEAARQMAEHLNDFSILEGNDFYSGISNRIMALIDLKQGMIPEARKHISLAVSQLDRSKKGDIHHWLAQQIYGIILFEAGEYAKARMTLENVLSFFAGISSNLSFVETALVLAMTCFHDQDDAGAVSYLQQGLERAENNNYRFLPLVNDRILASALVLSVCRDNKPQKDLSGLLSLTTHCDHRILVDIIDRELATAKQSRKTKIREALRPIYKNMLPRLKIKSLGRFSIQMEEKELDLSLFEGAKPIQLLKAIVLNGAANIPKEILIDNLWPEASARSGEKNFKINLHRLRKGIEPDAGKEFGYSYIIQKSGLVSLDPDLVVLDTDLFITLTRDAFSLEKQNRMEAALDLFQKAVDLYTGPYFTEDPYAEWIHRKRDFYRTRYIESLQKKAVLHEELDQTDQAIDTWKQVLVVDPVFELAYQNLMILYSDSNRNGMAVETFRDCEKILSDELDTEPSPQTLQIYKSICSR